MSKTSEQIKEALAHPSGDFRDSNCVCHLVPKLLFELDTKDKALELLADMKPHDVTIPVFFKGEDQTITALHINHKWETKRKIIFDALKIQIKAIEV